uniref:Uncharacterized protein n=1 Tax=Xiphophorus maculatus TaxID=8083 RepID=A0A3B5R1G2_XIPMA
MLSRPGLAGADTPAGRRAGLPFNKPRHRAHPEPRHRAHPEPRHRADPEPRHRAHPEPRHRADPEPRHRAHPEPRHRADPEPRFLRTASHFNGSRLTEHGSRDGMLAKCLLC